VTAMRIVQVGDVASVASALSSALAGLDEVHEVPFAQRAAKRSELLKLIAGPVRVYDAWRTARAIKRLKPDVVHVHWVPNGIVGIFLDVPWVLHCHGSDIRDLSRLRRAPYRWLVQRASGVAYSTPDLATVVVGLRPDAVYLPTPIARRDPTDERSWDVMIASRAHWSKGSEVAFEAARRLRGRSPRLQIAAVDGPDFEEGAERLKFTPKPEFVTQLARSRVVLGQFRLQALGIAEMEAMSVGRPVVTSVNRSLYPVPPPVRTARTPEEVVIAVEELLRDGRAADELGAAGRSWVLEHHDPAHIGERLHGLYQQVVSGGRGSQERQAES
jgi:glycosyltransferase involved in cell wall biosynthesis